MNLNPNHIAIILDGNRRFAKRLVLEPWKGHEYGEKKVEEFLDYGKELKIREITFYALSIENIKKRPKKELNYLYNIFRKAFENLSREKINKNKIKIKFIGDLDLLPKDLKDSCKRLERETKNNKKFFVNFAIAYGGRQEIINAVKKILEKEIHKKNRKIPNLGKLIERNLYLRSEPDLIIRTGGEKRTSNFLNWQAVYSEWLFVDKTWPEFQKEDLIQCIDDYKNRKRNFGK